MGSYSPQLQIFLILWYETWRPSIEFYSLLHRKVRTKFGKFSTLAAKINSLGNFKEAVRCRKVCLDWRHWYEVKISCFWLILVKIQPKIWRKIAFFNVLANFTHFIFWYNLALFENTVYDFELKFGPHMLWEVFYKSGAAIFEKKIFGRFLAENVQILAIFA